MKERSKKGRGRTTREALTGTPPPEEVDAKRLGKKDGENGIFFF